jgi:hypothetical protein
MRKRRFRAWLFYGKPTLWRRVLWWYGGGIGIAEVVEYPRWRWTSKVRFFLSYRLGIGAWFGGGEECEICGGTAEDCEYMMERTGPRHIRCVDRGECEEQAREAAESRGEAAA